MSLESFLTRGSEPAPVSDEPKEQPGPEQPQEAVPEPEPEPDTEAPTDKLEPEGEPEAEPGDRVELGKALVAARRDYKEKAARLEGELAELRRQVEEARKAPQAPQQQPQPPQPQYIPNPAQDPEAFAHWTQQRQADAEINTRLNITEFYAREKYGAEAVEAAKTEFAEAMKQNPMLQQQLFQHPAPYEFVMQQVEVLRLQREIGSDPRSYKERLEAEIRERVLAEMQQQTPPAPTVPRMGPSLAGARSSAPRSAPAFTGPTPLGDIFRR